jgi:starch-binding outer membrane protein, SusD/RagB family
MKANIFYLIIFVVVFTSCEDFLDKDPLNDYSVSTVYKTEKDIRFALNGLYRQIRGFNTSNINVNESEFSYSIWTDNAYHRSGSTQSSDLDFSSSKKTLGYDWKSRYTTIRDVNEFLARAPQAKENFSDPQLYDRCIAEARFIRAINYARMNFLYGTVPLITEPTDPDHFPKRATRKRVFDFVNDELSEIAEILPVNYNEPGNEVRITKGAALAIKARHLLNAIDWYPDKNHLYTEALEAAKEVYDSGIYSLDPGVNGYQKLFTRESANGASSGAILTINYNRDYKSHGYEVCILPKGAFSGARSNNANMVGATSSLVEAYQMKSTGLPVVDADSGYDPANPWNDRDPRLDITILRSGEIIPVKGGDGVNDLYVFDPHPKKNPSITLENGKVIESIKTDDINKKGINKTGYNYQKYMDFDFTESQSGDIQYHFIRFAEVILMYAEAVLGKDGNISLAMSLVDEVRNRVGMPDVNTTYGSVGSVDKALEIILHERRVEFALEGPQRFFDIRRHRLGEQLFSDPNVYGIPLGNNRKADAKVLDGDLDDSNKVIAGTRKFSAEQYYLWPIPMEAIEQNPNLTEAPE